MASQKLPSTSEPVMHRKIKPSASEAVKNIVLVGRTGNGKSATGNSLVGKKVFISESKATGVTTTCQTYTTVTPDGSRINVIDTPGLFDLSMSAESISKEIIDCLKLAEGELHVVVLVLSVRFRITLEEETTLRTLQVLFGNEILDYLIVLFTGGDELEEDNQTLDDYFHQGCPEFLKTVLRICGDRKVLFDNMTRDEGKKVEQVQQFLALVAKIEERNDGKPFKGKMHRYIKVVTERLSQDEKAVEARNLGEAELAEIMKQLQISKNMMSDIENNLKNELKENFAAQEKLIITLNEKMEKDQKKQKRLTIGLAAQDMLGGAIGPVGGAIGTMAVMAATGTCNIL